MTNMAWPEHEAHDLAETADYRIRAQLRNELRYSIDPVLQWQHCCFRPDQGLHRAGRLGYLPSLDAHNRKIDRSNFGYDISSFSRINPEIAVETINLQTLG